MSFQHQVFLFLAHASFKCMWQAWMVLADALGLRSAEWINSADEKKLLHACDYSSVERLLHQLGVQLELPVVDADHINSGADACQCLPDRLRVFWIPGGNRGKRIIAEH